MTKSTTAELCYTFFNSGAHTLRIVQIYKDYAPVVGGIENHIQALAQGLAARGHDVAVLVTNQARRTETITMNGVRVIKAARLAHLVSTPLSLDLMLQARHLHADVVNLHMPYPPGDLAALTIDAPLVVTYHSDIVRQQRLLQLYRPLLHISLRRAARIIATSAPYIQSSPFLRHYADKCRVVPLSVAADRFAHGSPEAVAIIRQRHNIEPHARVVLAAGVLRYYKGLHILLDAMRHIDAMLLLVGDGPERDRLEQIAAEYGIAHRVRFAGRVVDEELPAYYHAADVFVLASHLRAEAFGIVLLEAMAAGLPVVSTKLGTGTSVVNQHGVTGFVVPPADPHVLVRALQVLLANDELRHWIGEQARKRVLAYYTNERMIDGTLGMYDEARGL